jgi:hypothetical protein
MKEPELRRLWEGRQSNKLADLGAYFGFMSLLFCPSAPFSLVISVIGLRRIDPYAMPPVGRRNQAIVGIVCSVLGLLEGVALTPFALRLYAQLTQGRVWLQS